MPACFATGEAAGAAAALACRAGTPPARLDVDALRAHLLKAGAILA
ncbi:MAG TPA: FAD-dependent oxidoreductase [Myxococcota bacterium]|nr:FAD-dependent oxidoreductase [Myxococcota bacterium]